MRKRMPKFAFQVMIAALLGLAAPLMFTASAQAQTDWWSMFHHDSTNTGYSTTNAPDNGCLTWCVPGVITLSSPTVANGKVYAASLIEDYFCCFDAGTGEIIWCEETGPVLFSTPAVANGMVYIGTASGDIICFDAEMGGEPIWNFYVDYQVNSSPTVAYDKVYIGLYTGEIICLDAITGDYVWVYPMYGEVISTPAVSNGKVYVGSHDANIYCLDADNGDWIWEFTTGGGIFSSPAVTDTTVIIGSHDGSIYCLDADTGDFIWEYSLGDSIFASPAIAYGMVYAVTKNGYIVCLDADNPDPPVWSNGLLGEVVLASPAVADNIVLVATLDGVLVGFDALTGHDLWYSNLIGGPAGSPAIVDGNIYMISGGYLYSLDGEPYAQNIAIADVNPSKTSICHGDSIIIDVSIENLNVSCSDPVAFNCVVYYDELAPTTPVQREMFRTLGDINMEGFIDSLDLALLAHALGSKPGDCNWNPNADLNGDQSVNVVDAMTLAMNQGDDIWTHFVLGEQTIIAKEHVFEMIAAESPLSLPVEWKTADVPLGSHTVSAYVSQVPNEYYTADNYGSTIPVTLSTTFDLVITATQGQTTIPPPGTYPCPCNEDNVVEATPDFWFSYWELDGENVGSENPYSVFMDEDHTLHAVYKSILEDETAPSALSLYQNFPNPFNPTTNIVYTLPRDSHVSIRIFDPSGRLLRVLVDEFVEVGRHEVTWDGKDGNGRAVASGVYFCSMEAEGFKETKKMLLLR